MMHRTLGIVFLSVLALGAPRRAQAQESSDRGAVWGGVQAALVCRNVVCRCESASAGTDASRGTAVPDSSECPTLTCWCDDDAPRGRRLPVVPAPPTGAAQAQDDEPVSNVPSEGGRVQRTLPVALDRPVQVAGFTLSDSRVGALFELGYPFIDFKFSFRLHQWVDLAIGYRGLYTLTNAGYASLKIRLFENRPGTVGLSLGLLGGYTVNDQEGYTYLVGASSGFGEVLLALSLRRGRHAFDFIAGANAQRPLSLLWM